MVTLQWWHKIAVGICPFSCEWYPISLIRTFVLGPISSRLVTWKYNRRRPILYHHNTDWSLWGRGLYHQYYMIMDFEAMERVQQGQCNGVPSRWMGDTRFWKRISGENRHATVNYKLSYSQEKHRVNDHANASLPIRRSKRIDITSCPCWQIWLQGCGDLLRWHRYFCNVTHVSVQD